MTKNISNELEKIHQRLDELYKMCDEILHFNEVCEYLGLSKSYLYKLTMEGKIPHYKPMGKKLFFSKKEIDNWVKTYFDKDKGGE